MPPPIKITGRRGRLPLLGAVDSGCPRLRTEILVRSTQSEVLAELSKAGGATFDPRVNEHKGYCLEHTRTDLLQEITTWAQDPNAQTIYWVEGTAGSGKSTISRTLAYTCSRNTTLGACFFFEKGHRDHGGISKFIPTIASQLVQRVPDTATHVKRAINSDPAIFSRAMREQFHKLILDPLSKCSPAEPVDLTFLVVVVDALDECDGEDDVKRLIELSSAAKTSRNPRLKFFFTSQPELPIRLGLKRLSGSEEDFVFYNLDERGTEHDLAVFFQHELLQIRHNYNATVPKGRQLPESWPDQADLEALIQMPSPLFIFAATVCRFVADRKGGTPNEKLQKVLEYRSMQGSTLTATYMPIFEQWIMSSSQDQEQDMLRRFREVVGTIVLLEDPLSTSGLAQLLAIDCEDVLSVVDLLPSVLHVPSSLHQPIRLFHLSFRDFLIDSVLRHPFLIDEKEIHGHLAKACLGVLQGSLKTDICEVQHPGTLASSIIATEVNKKLPSGLQYACRFWSHHIGKADLIITDECEVWNFLTTHFLHWLEALCWLGRLSESLQAIQTLQSLVQPDNCQRMSEFLADATQFIRATSSIIQNAPLQLYYSALLFSPSASVVRTNYEGDMGDWILLKPKVPVSWGQMRQTLEGHTKPVTLVVFSPDGTLVASASSDRTVRIWAVGGALQQTLEGHTKSITFVAFSPDGRLIASASYDRTVRIWTVDGDLKRTFEGHTFGVTSVAFSPDGRLISSTSYDWTVRVWAVDGSLQQTLKGHTNSATLVSFSPDGQRLASSSDDNTVRIWSVHTGHMQQALAIPTVISALSFGSNNQIVVNLGAYILQSTPDVDVAEGSNTHIHSFITHRMRLSGPKHGAMHGLSEDNCWIIFNGRKILWLPDDWRPSSWKIFGSTVAIGCTSGRVWIICFKKSNDTSLMSG